MPNLLVRRNLLMKNFHSTTLQNDFFINLTGDDELCDTQEDQDFIEDLVDGDAAILNDLAT